jgi:hypothetical protein
MNNLPETAVLLISDQWGIYIPQRFAELEFESPLDIVSNADEFAILEDGPDHEWYWEAWETVLRTCIMRDRDGLDYYLYQDGDLWAIPVGGPFPVGTEWED